MPCPGWLSGFAARGTFQGALEAFPGLGRSGDLWEVLFGRFEMFQGKVYEK